MDKITTVGIDLAKNVFSVHAIAEGGAVLIRKTVSRARLVAMVAQWPACLIGVEACPGAHELSGRPHSQPKPRCTTVRLEREFK